MGEYLSFDKLITPTLVRILFWALVVVSILVAISDIFGGSFWRGVAIFFLGPLVARVYCEIIIVLFQINNILTEIRDEQRDAARRAPATIVTPPAP